MCQNIIKNSGCVYNASAVASQNDITFALNGQTVFDRKVIKFCGKKAKSGGNCVFGEKNEWTLHF